MRTEGVSIALEGKRHSLDVIARTHALGFFLSKGCTKQHTAHLVSGTVGLCGMLHRRHKTSPDNALPFLFCTVHASRMRVEPGVVAWEPVRVEGRPCRTERTTQGCLKKYKHLSAATGDPQASKNKEVWVLFFSYLPKAFYFI